MSFKVMVTWNSKKIPYSKSQLAKVSTGILAAMSDSLELQFWIKKMKARPSSLNLFLTDDLEIRKLNREFRKLDRATDVLSFPTLELALNEVEIQRGSLGDLVMSEAALWRGAQKMTHSYEEEFLEVYIHGFLHLLGFDHVSSKPRAKRMFEVQGELFSWAKSTIKVSHGKHSNRRRSTPSKLPRIKRKIKKSL